MAVIYSKNTQLFLKELTAIQQTPKNKEDRQLRGKAKQSAPKVYNGNTDDFEPIPENREHLIKTLMPMVVKMAKTMASKFGDKIEYDDCISAGMQGAIIATDRYIEKSMIEKQPAKLSTYAYAYIMKYVNEHCYKHNSSLSYSVAEWKRAADEYVMSGNMQYKDEGKAVEFFDIANDSNLKSKQDDIDDASEHAETVSSTLFAKLSDFDKSVIFLTFGIGLPEGQGLRSVDVAKRLKTSSNVVEKSLKRAISIMQESVEEENIPKVIMILKSVDLTRLPSWNL